MIYTNTYILKEKDKEIGRAELIIEPFDVIVTSFSVSKEDYLPEDLRALIDKCKSKEDALYYWMHTRVPELPYAGHKLDEYIVQELGISPNIMANGRLSGMENIIALRNYYKSETDDFTLSPESIVPICFFNLVGWNKILLSRPLENHTKEETKNAVNAQK